MSDPQASSSQPPLTPTPTIPTIPTTPTTPSTPSIPTPATAQVLKSIYFYGDNKSGGDAPVKAEYIFIKKSTIVTEPSATEGNDKGETVTAENNNTNNEDVSIPQQNVSVESMEGSATVPDSDVANQNPTLPTSEDKGKKRVNEKPSIKQAKKQRLAAQSAGICLKIASGETCPFGEKCKYSHDAKKYIEAKEPDLGDTCYMFSTYGFCPYGLSCRFGSAHIKDFKHVINEELLAKMGKPPVINNINKQTQFELRKDRRKFPKSIPLIQKYARLQQGTQATAPVTPASASVPLPSTSSSSSSTITATTTPGTTSSTSTISPPTPSPPDASTNVVGPKTTIEFPPELDVETRLRPAEKKQVDFKGKLYLAPLTTNGNLPFRRICKTLGADITCGEMALASNLLKGQASEWALLRRHPSEDVFGIQVCGAFVDQMTYCAELIEQEDLNVDFVDINSGCPIDIICNKGMGSALLDKPRRIEGLLRSMSEVLTRPLTIKLRMGRDDKSSVAHKLIPNLKLWGADAVTLHGRTRVQRYSRVADWDYINSCSKISPIPLIGNGDIYNWQEAVHYMEHSSVSSIMIARSAIIKPWIFTEIKERRDWDISASERFDMLKDFANYGLEHWGSDTQGVEKTRNFMLNWISFLCRYVPVGLLERLPSRINERPPNFYGRSDLETLLGSRNVSDWVKISEMILGPVPASFHFEPKHKSNSYEDAQG